MITNLNSWSLGPALLEAPGLNPNKSRDPIAISIPVPTPGSPSPRPSDHTRTRAAAANSHPICSHPATYGTHNKVGIAVLSDPPSSRPAICPPHRHRPIPAAPKPLPVSIPDPPQVNIFIRHNPLFYRPLQKIPFRFWFPRDSHVAQVSQPASPQTNHSRPHTPITSASNLHLRAFFIHRKRLVCRDLQNFPFSKI